MEIFWSKSFLNLLKRFEVRTIFSMNNSPMLMTTLVWTLRVFGSMPRFIFFLSLNCELVYYYIGSDVCINMNLKIDGQNCDYTLLFRCCWTSFMKRYISFVWLAKAVIDFRWFCLLLSPATERNNDMSTSHLAPNIIQRYCLINELSM